MTTLDALLYQWIGEPDESRADRAFQTYFSAAFPALVRHVQHRTGWDLGSAEDIAQEALLRFFERVGRGRRETAVAIITAARQVTAFAPDPLRSRALASWASDVNTFANSIVTSCFSPDRTLAEDELRLIAGKVSVEVLSLKRDGWRLLDEVRRTLQRFLDGDSQSPSELPTMHFATLDEAASANFDEREVARFSDNLLLDAPRAARVEQRYPGVKQLVDAMLTITKTLPRLRIPTNGYLFDIATSTFLDEIKRRRRKKRGGPEERGSDPNDLLCNTNIVSGHPLETVPDESQTTCDRGIWRDGHRAPGGNSHFTTVMPNIPVDPMARYEDAEFLQRFYEYLRAPVAGAVRALEEAQDTGRPLAAQCRLESVSRKFSRMMAVLSMLGEGYTQEETARANSLSRNQVKYIVETVKQAYVRFAAAEPLAPRPGVKRKGEPHAS